MWGVNDIFKAKILAILIIVCNFGTASREAGSVFFLNLKLQTMNQALKKIEKDVLYPVPTESEVEKTYSRVFDLELDV